MQMITGFPADLGDELLTSPDVSLISFTGSVPAAILIAGKAANSLKRTAFELGGTDAMIVLDDADLSAAADAVVTGRLTNGAGQICCAVKRVLVDQKVYEPFLQLLQERSKAIRMGDPACEETDLGPLITSEAAAKADQQIQQSIAMGARCLTGGRRVGRSFYEPTILVDVTKDMPVMKDEVFAPVAPVWVFNDIAAAIDMANDSTFGLQASVFTSNINSALRVAHQLDVGGVVINGTGAFRPGNVPFGGNKHSGIGRESIVETVREMTSEKTVVINNAI
jgi:glyceraldehyde-3-phosphate dehydrogenase (NADP+)